MNSRYLNKYAHWPAGIDFLASVKHADTIVRKLTNSSDSAACSAQYKLLIIPAFGESDAFLHALMQREDANSLLLVLHVNEPKTGEQLVGRQPVDSLSHQNLALKKANRVLVEGIKQRSSSTLRCSNSVSLHKLQRLQILLIESTKDYALDSDIAVGLARKIAADFALLLRHRAPAVFTPYLFFTDADCKLSENYFLAVEQCFKKENAAAIVSTIKHERVFSNTLETFPAAVQNTVCATQLYERAITFYSQALALAGCGYSYIPIGSTISVSTKAYEQVRGVPLRAAGEDFYLLNKLNKLVAAHPSTRDHSKQLDSEDFVQNVNRNHMNDEQVHLELQEAVRLPATIIGGVQSTLNAVVAADVRTSPRCPFGTGQSVAQILSDPFNQGSIASRTAQTSTADTENTSVETLHLRQGSAELRMKYYKAELFVALALFHQLLQSLCTATYCADSENANDSSVESYAHAISTKATSTFLAHVNGRRFWKNFLRKRSSDLGEPIYDDIEDILTKTFEHLTVIKLYRHLSKQFPLEGHSCSDYSAMMHQRKKAVFVWFDAFRILKCVHFLRAHWFPDQYYSHHQFDAEESKLRNYLADFTFPSCKKIHHTA